MNGGNYRDRKRVDLGHNLLPLARQRFGFCGAGTTSNHVDIGAGDKVVGFSGDKYGAAQRFILTDLADYRPHLAAELGFQGIHLFAGRVDGDNGDIIRTNFKRKSCCRFHYSASRAIAEPKPPAAQAVTRPNPPPRRRSSCNVCVIMRAPVAAKGCP